MKITITILDDESAEQDHELPAAWAICDRCEGNGKHDPEAFRNGFSREDFDEDPDFAEAYRAGRYDVPCEECHGSGKVLIVDADRLNDAQRAIYRRHCEAETERAAWARADAITRRMESGGFDY